VLFRKGKKGIKIFLNVLDKGTWNKSSNSLLSWEKKNKSPEKPLTTTPCP